MVLERGLGRLVPRLGSLEFVRTAGDLEPMAVEPNDAIDRNELVDPMLRAELRER